MADDQYVDFDNNEESNVTYLSYPIFFRDSDMRKTLLVFNLPKLIKPSVENQVFSFLNLYINR